MSSNWFVFASCDCECLEIKWYTPSTHEKIKTVSLRISFSPKTNFTIELIWPNFIVFRCPLCRSLRFFFVWARNSGLAPYF